MSKRKSIGVLVFFCLSVSFFAQQRNVDFYTTGGQFEEGASDFSKNTEYYAIHTDKEGEYDVEEIYTGKIFSEKQDIAFKTKYLRDSSGMIITQNYWNYDVVPSGGNFYKGARTGYLGPSFYCGNLLNSFIDYCILEQIFGVDTPYYFPYSLFNITVS